MSNSLPKEEPHVFGHGISVSQSETSASAIPPGARHVGQTDFFDANLEVSPNPTTGMAALQLDLPEAAEVDIRLLDVLGRPVEILQSLQTTGSQSFEVDLSQHRKWLYRVVATGERTAHSQNFVVAALSSPENLIFAT